MGRFAPQLANYSLAQFSSVCSLCCERAFTLLCTSVYRKSAVSEIITVCKSKTAQLTVICEQIVKNVYTGETHAPWFVFDLRPHINCNVSLLTYLLETSTAIAL